MKLLLRRYSRDLLVIAVLAFAGGMLSWRTSAATTAAIGGRDGIWFGAEVGDTLRRATSEKVAHNRTLHHPLMPSLTRVPSRLALRLAPSIQPLSIVRLALVTAAGAWAAGLFLLCRSIGCRRSDAILFSLIGLTSAAAIFWAGVPDIELFIAVTVLPAVATAAVATRRETSSAATWLTVVACSMSLDITQGLTGTLAAATRHSWRRTLQITANAATVLIVLCSLQRLVLPSNGRIQDHDPADRPTIRATLLTAPLSPVPSMIFYSMVMPDLEAQAALSIQHASWWPATIAGGAARGAWAALLIIALRCALPLPAARMRTFLLAAIGAQLVLQLLIDGETFHSAMSLLPLLIALVSLGSLSSQRRAVVALSLVLLVSAAVNNSHQFERSLNLAGASAVMSSR